MEKVIKDHPCSKLWTLEDDPGYIYKWQPKFLTENELWCLEKMSLSFVPFVERCDLEVLKLEFIEDETPTNVRLLLSHTARALEALGAHGIRHGDLTRPNVLIRDNTPILLDFAESRLTTDPRPDKRPEGDEYWLNRTVREIIYGGS